MTGRPASYKVGPTRLDFTRSGELAEAARECEAEVFFEHYGNTREELDRELGPYLDHTGFLTLSRLDGEVVAAARLIMPSPAGFKTLDDLAKEPWDVDPGEVTRLAGIDPAQTLDIATLCVRRGSILLSGTAAILLHGLTLTYRANSIRWALGIIDTRVRSLHNVSGLRWETLPLTWAAPYLGSASSVPVLARIPQQLDEQRRLSPESYRLVTLGIGLGEVEVPDLATFRWPSDS